MTPDLIHAAIALVVALLLAVWLGRMYRPSKGGLSEADTREVLVVVSVVAVLTMVGLDRTVPDWLIGMVLMMVGYFFGSRKDGKNSTADNADVADVPANLPQSIGGQKIVPPNAGFASFRILLLIASVFSVCSVGALFSGCTTTAPQGQSASIGANIVRLGQPIVNKAIGPQYAALNNAFVDKLLTDPNALPANATVREIFADNLGTPLTNGVRRIHQATWEDVLSEPAAPAPLPVPVPAIENLKSQIADSTLSAPDKQNATAASSVATPAPVAESSLPPPNQVRDSSTTGLPSPAEAIGNGGTSSNSNKRDAQGNETPATGNDQPVAGVVETRVYSAAAHVTIAEGLLSASVADASGSAEISVVSDGARALASGRIVSMTNAAFQDVAGLSFSNYPATITNGEITVTNRPGSDVIFSGRGDLASGALVASLSPKIGSSAALLFQRLEISGTATLVSTAITTNAPIIEDAKAQSADLPGDAISIEGMSFPGRPNAAKARITRTLHRCGISGGNATLNFDRLGWSTETGKNGKTIDGGVYIFWAEGGKTRGGFFDWHGLNQTSKTMNNIPEILDGAQPPKDADVFFCIVNREGTQRTNVEKSENRWP